MSNVKLTLKQVTEIRQRYLSRGHDGAGLEMLAQRYGVSVATVHRVLTGEHPVAQGLPNISGQRGHGVHGGWGNKDYQPVSAPTRRLIGLGESQAEKQARNPIRFECPRCGAKPNYPCTNPRSTVYVKALTRPHRERGPA